MKKQLLLTACVGLFVASCGNGEADKKAVEEAKAKLEADKAAGKLSEEEIKIKEGKIEAIEKQSTL